MNVFGQKGLFTRKYNFFRDIFHLLPSQGNLNTAGNISIPSIQDGSMVFVRYNSLTVNAGHTIAPSNRCAGLVVVVDGNAVISGSISMSARGADVAVKPMYNKVSISYSTSDPGAIVRYERKHGDKIFNPYVELPVYQGIVAARVWDTTSQVLQASDTCSGAGTRGCCGGSNSPGTGVRGGSGNGGNNLGGSAHVARGPYGGAGCAGGGYNAGGGAGVYPGYSHSGHTGQTGAGGWLLVVVGGNISGTGTIISSGVNGSTPPGDAYGSNGSGGGCVQVYLGTTSSQTTYSAPAGSGAYSGYANGFFLSTQGAI